VSAAADQSAKAMPPLWQYLAAGEKNEG